MFKKERNGTEGKTLRYYNTNIILEFSLLSRCFLKKIFIYFILFYYKNIASNIAKYMRQNTFQNLRTKSN